MGNGRKINGQKINSVTFTLAQAFLSGIISYRTVVDNSRKKLHYLPLQRSFEVTRGHQPSFANNFWSKRDRDVGLVSVRSSWPGESTDMQYDPFRSWRDLGLTWPEVKLWPWPFKVIIYMVRRALTRQTRWYQIRCSIFKIKDFIVEKPFWKILEFWPLETSILTWAKKWPKWFRNDFSRAFERCLSFFSTATGSRDHGGGRSNAPPPPAGGGKSRGPAGRGLIPCNSIYSFYSYLYATNYVLRSFFAFSPKPTHKHVLRRQMTEIGNLTSWPQMTLTSETVTSH